MVKEDYLETTFPYYPSNIETKKPLGEVSLKEFIRAVKNPKKEIVDLFKKIKKASKDGDLQLKAQLKKGLFYFNPCVNTDGKGRSYSNITNFTGFAQIDFDGIDYPCEFRDWFFKKVKSCAVCGVSSSGLGVKAIIRIPVVQSVEEYKQYFHGIGYYLEKYKGFDIAPQNPILPLYIFHDPDVKYRDNATVSTVRGLKINAFKKFEGDITPVENVNFDDIYFIKNIFKKKIREIQDNGHPQVVAASCMLGGYYISGYLTEDESMDLIEKEIPKNEYLSKNIKGYIRTAKEMFNRGSNSPLYLERDE